MATKPSFGLGDRLHRLMKQAIDSGACKSIAEAEMLFAKYKLHLEISAADAEVPEHQAALLTAVLLAHRVCLGGVTVDDAGGAKLALPVPLGRTLNDAVASLGGVVGQWDLAAPTITIGDAPKNRREGFHVRTSYAGWRGGIVPGDSELRAQGETAIPLASTLAAAIAVNEAYSFMSQTSSVFGRRVVGLSLWNPRSLGDWLAGADEPTLSNLPSKLWLIGLGHLGQAYLWTLGLLPYPEPSSCSLVLQDTDIITPSSESTSVLSADNNIGVMKTRAMAQWAEGRGFKASIYERIFDGSFHRRPDEPAVALCGIDNTLGRAVLDQVGFGFVVEAGLGRGHRDFRTVRLHTLPGSRKAAEIWRQKPVSESAAALNEAYQRLLREGTLDQCGITLLAGKAVGAPFVGMVAAALALSEVLRLLHGGGLCQLMDVDLEAVEHRTVTSHPFDFSNMNPGFVPVRVS